MTLSENLTPEQIKSFLLNAAKKYENVYDEALEVLDQETGELMFDGSDMLTADAVLLFLEEVYGNLWDDGEHASKYIGNLYENKNGKVELYEWVKELISIIDGYKKSGEHRIKIDGWKCLRCGNIWAPRSKKYPKVCPDCKSPYWDIKKKRK